MAVSLDEFVYGDEDSIGFTSRRDLAQAVINLRGEPLSLDRYLPMREIYEDTSREILLVAGRQVGKSVTLMQNLLTNAATMPFFTQVFVSPLKEQTVRFSNLYVSDTIKHSPALAKFFLSKSGDNVQNVHTRTFSNGSSLFLTYALDNADRLRGIPADAVFADEVQDMVQDVIPVIMSCMKASKHRRRIFSGTPKTFDNTIEGFWKKSTKYEWAMKCQSCGYWSVPTEDYIEKMIDVTKPAGEGIVCPRSCCRKPLDITKGQWVSFGDPEATTRGYHLPQIIFPHNVYDEVGWADFKDDYRGIDDDPNATFSRKQIYNEMLGLSYDIGGKLLTKAELEACCDESKVFLNTIEEVKATGLDTTYGGVDWGVGGDKSFTVVSVVSPDIHGRLTVVYARKFPAGDPLQQIDEICGIFRRFRVSRVGADYGNGYVYNQYLRKALGLDRVYVFQYVASRAFVTYNTQGGHYTVDRTNIMNLLFMSLKQRKFVFPKLNSCGAYFDDIMSIYEDEIRAPSGSRKVFRRSHDQPDDFFHSLLYADLAYKLSNGDPVLDLDTVDHTYPTSVESDAGQFNQVNAVPEEDCGW